MFRLPYYTSTNWEGILFSGFPCPCASVRPSIMLCFLNILKSYWWNFIKPCKHYIQVKDCWWNVKNQIKQTNKETWVYDQLKFKPAYLATETSWNIDFFHVACLHIILFRERKTKVLISLHRWAWWSLTLWFPCKVYVSKDKG